MYRRANLIGPTLAALGALSLFGCAGVVQFRQWNDPSATYVIVMALVASGAALILTAGFLWWKRVQAGARAPAASETARARQRVPFWVAEEAPFERPPRR